MIFLSWWPDQTADAFAAAVADQVCTAKDGEAVYLNLNHDFLRRFPDLPAPAAARLRAALAAAPVTSLAVSYFAPPDGTELPQPLQARQGSGSGSGARDGSFRSLWKTLGAIPTIRTVSVGYQDGMGRTLGQVLRRLTHVTEVVVVARREGGRHDFHNLVAGLRHHPSLKSVVLDVLPGYYRAALPHLPSLSRLRRVHLLARTGDMVVDTADVDAIMALMHFNTELQVVLERLDVSRREYRGALCRGLAQATIHGLRIHQCILGGDAAVLGRALSQSRIKSLELSFRRASDDWAFIESFGRHLGAHSPLVALNCDFSSLRGKPECPGGALTLVRGASSCPRLMRLKLALPLWSDPLDEALARCISVNPCLEELEVHCPASPSRRRPITLPLLCQALQSNFTVKDIRFSGLGGVPNLQLWDPDLQRTLATLLRLNRSGRGYLARDAANQRRTIRTLGHVSDDLDCLFVHLTENPLLLTSQL